MTAQQKPPFKRERLNPGRVEALSDGVFSVAVTLLVLNIQIPHFGADKTASDLVAAMLEQWPSYLAFALTFISLGSVWVSHHQMFRYVEAVDSNVQKLNILFLMCVTLNPFTNAFLAQYLTQPDKLRIAVFVCGGLWTFQGIFLAAMWFYLQRSGLVRADVDTVTRRRATRLFSTGTLFGVVGLVFALPNPVITVVIYVAIAIFYMLPTERFFG